MAGGAQRKGEGAEVTPILQTKGLWPRVDSNNPCPICGNSDWCTLGQKVVHCMRVESSKPCHAGGWYHPYPGGATPEPIHHPAPPRSAPTVDADPANRAVGGRDLADCRPWKISGEGPAHANREPVSAQLDP